MAVNLKQLEWLRTIPTIGSRLYDFGKSISDHLATVEQQANVNFSSQPPAPPQINAFQMSTGPSGEHQFTITDNGEFSRNNHYFIDYDTSPQFSNPHTIDNGQSRNCSINRPGQTLYGRARSAYPTGESSDWVYHGSPSSPMPVLGGVAGLRAPSQGSGTGAPGAGGGPGPIPTRNAKAGYNWKSQVAIPQGVRVGSFPQVTPMGGGVAAGGQGGGGAPIAVVPVSATVLGSDASATLIPAPLATAKVWIGSAGSLPVAQSITGPVSLTAAGVTAIIPTAATFTPTLTFGGVSTGITYSTQAGDYIEIGSMVIARVNITLSSKGTATGNAVITGLPFAANGAIGPFGGSVAYSANIVITTQFLVDMNAGTSALILQDWNNTGGAVMLTDAAFFNTSALLLSITYFK